MGVRHYNCSCCDEIFADVERGVIFCRCGEKFCSEECAKDFGYVKKHGESSCYGCREEDKPTTEEFSSYVEIMNELHAMQKIAKEVKDELQKMKKSIDALHYL